MLSDRLKQATTNVFVQVANPAIFLTEAHGIFLGELACWSAEHPTANHSDLLESKTSAQFRNLSWNFKEKKKKTKAICGWYH